MKDNTLYPLVSIISVNYNTDSVTADMLHSLQVVTYPNIEVIVVDNASATDASYLTQLFPHIKFIQNPVNEGFAGGNNRGIEQANGDIILLLNNDTEVAPGFIEPIVALFNSHPDIGIISPKIRYFHAPGIIQYAGGEPINPFTTRGKFIGAGEIDKGQHDTPRQTQLAHGAAMAIHRNVFDTIGMLPEQYFLYYEELDFCAHALRAGYTIWYQPTSVVLHKESMSVGKTSAIKVYYQNRNRLLYIRRNVFGLQGLLARLFFVFISAPAGIVKFLARRQPGFAWQIVRGLGWNLWRKSSD